MTEVNLGSAVRRLRETQGTSLRALAEASGFSASFLSQVENGQASPSISSMERIATALGVTLAEFFQEAQGGTEPVTRASGRLTMHSEWSRAQIEVVAAGMNGQRLASVLVTLEPGGSSGKRATASLGEEFALVQEGSVELTLNDVEQVLGPGDAVTIAKGALRRWHNGGAEPVRILIVALR